MRSHKWGYKSADRGFKYTIVTLLITPLKWEFPKIGDPNIVP